MINNSNQFIRIYFQPEYDEYQVILPRAATNSASTYFTDDKQDALATAEHLVADASRFSDLPVKVDTRIRRAGH